MSSLSTLLVVLCALAACQLQVTNTRSLPTINQSADFLCIPATFPDGHVCKTLFPNLTSIMAPNPKQINEERSESISFHTSEDHFAASLAEFRAVEGILTEEDLCSNKIATLLCFFYFPSCMQSEISSLKYTAFPCRSLCQEVTALDSECTKRIEGKWGPIFSGCNYTYGEDDSGHTRQVYSEENCVNETHLSYFDVTHPEVVKPESCKTLDSTMLTSSWKSKCNYKRRASSQIFVGNNYNFAINCTVNSVSAHISFGKEVINCTVNKQFPVKTDGSCTEAPVLEENKSILILGHNSACKSKPKFHAKRNSIKIKGTYIVAGKYVTREDCEDTLWYGHLVAPITQKLDQFKTLVADGNSLRSCD